MSLVVFAIPIFWMDMKNIPNYWNRWNIFEVCILRTNIEHFYAVTVPTRD